MYGSAGSTLPLAPALHGLSRGLPLSMLALLASLSAFQAPSTPGSFRSYLLGDWTVRKAVNYKSGGVSGRFSGDASFSMLEANKPHLWSYIAYKESGTFVPNQSEDFPSLETRNRLLYDFSESKTKVYYDELSEGERSDTETVVSRASFLYALEPRGEGTLAIESTSAGELSYSGSIDVEAPNAFIITWRVHGPGQDGEIASLFKRAGIEEDGTVDVDAV